MLILKYVLIVVNKRQKIPNLMVELQTKPENGYHVKLHNARTENRAAAIEQQSNLDLMYII